MTEVAYKQKGLFAHMVPEESEPVMRGKHGSSLEQKPRAHILNLQTGNRKLAMGQVKPRKPPSVTGRCPDMTTHPTTPHTASPTAEKAVKCVRLSMSHSNTRIPFPGLPVVL